MIIDKLIDKIIETQNPTAVGLDTAMEYLPSDMLEKCDSYENIGNMLFEFNKNIIDNVKDLVPAVKVQVAYYEQYGVEGMRAFEKTLRYAKERGLITIADVKRNDIGSTAGAYSRAYISGNEINGKRYVPFEADFVTVNGYLGSDGIMPFVEDCKKYDKGLFVLVKTSNPASGELQDKTMENGKTLYENMADLVDVWGKDLIGKYGYSSIGAVIGATHKEQAEDVRRKHKNIFFLIPGYGAQGGKATDLAVSFVNGIGGIVNNSRGILCAYKKDEYKGQTYYEAARNAVIKMKEDLNSAIK